MLTAVASGPLQTGRVVTATVEEDVTVAEAELLSCGCCEVEQWDARVWRQAWQERVVW